MSYRSSHFGDPGNICYLPPRLPFYCSSSHNLSCRSLRFDLFIFARNFVYRTRLHFSFIPATLKLSRGSRSQFQFLFWPMPEARIISGSPFQKQLRLCFTKKGSAQTSESTYMLTLQDNSVPRSLHSN